MESDEILNNKLLRETEIEEDADEDVILPNSPLCDYMKNLNLEEENNLFLDQNKNQANIAKSSELTFKNCVNHFTSMSLYAIKVFNLFDFIHLIFLSHVSVLEYLLLRKSFNGIFVQNILIEEDREFILNWNSEKKTIANYSFVFRTFVIIYSILFSILILTYNIITLYSKNLMDIFFDMQSIIHLNLCVFSCLILAVNVIQTSRCCLIWIRFKNLSPCMKHLYSNFKKSIRLIQEAELVARGFTSASVYSSADRIEVSSVLPVAKICRQYTDLRKSIFTYMKIVFLEYRSATNNLIDTISKDIDLDFTSNYLAKLDIKEFGMILQYDANLVTEYQELLKVTDNLCITSLKTLFGVMELQVSEFFKCLYLASDIYAESKPKNNGFFQAIKSKKLVDLSDLSQRMNVLTKKVERKYKYYRCFDILPSSDLKPKTPSFSSDLPVTIHNMSLHLKAALWKLVEMEDKFFNKKETLFREKSLVKDISALLSAVKSEISVYEEHFKKCDELLNEILNEDKKEQISSMVKSAEIEKCKDNSFEAVVKRCDVENKIEDEVFEDVICDEVHNTGPLVSNIYPQEECMKNYKLLKELKNVLVVKADEHKTREKIALKKKIQDHETSDNDNEFSNKNSDFKNPKEEINIPFKDISGICMEDINIPPNDPPMESHPKKDINIPPKDISGMEEINLPPQVIGDICIESQIGTRDFKDKLGFLLNQKCSEEVGIPKNSKDSFSAAIASMAAQQRQILGLTSEEFGCDVDSSDESDTE